MDMTADNAMIDKQTRESNHIKTGIAAKKHTSIYIAVNSHGQLERKVPININIHDKFSKDHAPSLCGCQFLVNVVVTILTAWKQPFLIQSFPMKPFPMPLHRPSDLITTPMTAPNHSVPRSQPWCSPDAALNHIQAFRPPIAALITDRLLENLNYSRSPTVLTL